VAADHLSSGVAGQSVLVVGYVVLALFLWANRLLVGVGLLAVGLAANAVVTVVDRGMPVRASAMVAAGLGGPDGHVAAPQGARHHLEGPGDQLVVLDDHLAVRPLRRVVSYGDVLLAVGALDVLGRLAWGGVTSRPRTRVGTEPQRTPTPAAAGPGPLSTPPGARPPRTPRPSPQHAPRPVVRTA